MLRRHAAAPSLVAGLIALSNVGIARASEPSGTSTETSDATKPPKPFVVDPVTSGALIATSGGVAAITQVIISTGEITPQRAGSPEKLLGIDQGAVSQSVDPAASVVSNVGLTMAIGFALLDPVLSGFREDASATLIDATLYAESLSLTLAVAGITKIAVRRPRPSAYVEQARLDAEFGAANAPTVADTDSALSFFSGHTAIVAATSATATYLAFVRSKSSWRPWVTFGAGVLLTSGVGYERVRAGAHFPTDVIAGAIAGAGIGLLVPHLHRNDSGGRRVWIGAAPTGSGGSLSIQGCF